MAIMPPFVSPDDALLDAGVLTVGAVPVGFGATKGGLTFDPGIQIHSIEYDGGRTPKAGLDRRLGGKSVIKGKFLEANLAALMRYEPGSTSAVSGSTTTVTPKPNGPSFVIGDYLLDVGLHFRGQSGKVKHLYFDAGIVTKYTLTTTDNNEGEFDMEIEGRLLDTETDLTKNCYHWGDET